MLKIRDDVDLKELEKYGFITRINNYDGYPIYEKMQNTDKVEYGLLINDYYDDHNKTIEYYFNNNMDIHQDIDLSDKESLDVLYDLIKADLVEKVEDVK